MALLRVPLTSPQLLPLLMQSFSHTSSVRAYPRMLIQPRPRQTRGEEGTANQMSEKIWTFEPLEI